MEKGQLWTVVGVAFVVAVIASVVASSITGNIIRVNYDKKGAYNVYTTEEVNSKLNILNSKIITQEKQISNLTIELNITQSMLNNTINVVSYVVNQTIKNSTIVGNWSVPANVTVVINKTASKKALPEW